MTNSDPRLSAESCDLKPCPFCGKPPVMIASTEDDSFVRCYEIRCDQCGIEVSEEYKSETIEHWNTRTGAPAQSVGMREALERIAKQQLVEERLVEGGDYEYGYEQIVKIARAALAASQPSPAATVDRRDSHIYGVLETEQRAHNGSSAATEREELADEMIMRAADAMIEVNSLNQGLKFTELMRAMANAALTSAGALPVRTLNEPQAVVVTDEMVTAAMRAFEPMSSVLRYREKDKWHSCDIMGMRDALKAALALSRPELGPSASSPADSAPSQRLPE